MFPARHVRRGGASQTNAALAIPARGKQGNYASRLVPVCEQGRPAGRFFGDTLCPHLWNVTGLVTLPKVWVLSGSEQVAYLGNGYQSADARHARVKVPTIGQCGLAGSPWHANRSTDSSESKRSNGAAKLRACANRPIASGA